LFGEPAREPCPPRSGTRRPYDRWNIVEIKPSLQRHWVRRLQDPETPSCSDQRETVQKKNMARGPIDYSLAPSPRTLPDPETEELVVGAP
jgi:hypothetical protein